MRRRRRTVRRSPPLLNMALLAASMAIVTSGPASAMPYVTSTPPNPQEIPPVAPDVQETPSDPDRQAIAVPVIDIPRRADATRALLARLAATAQPDPSVNALAATLPDSLDLLDGLLAAARGIDLGQAPRLQVADMARGWSRQEARLDRWTDRVDSRWRELQTAWDATKNAQSTWSVTRDELESSKSSPAVRTSLSTSIEGVLAHADSVEAMLDRRLTFVVRVQRDLSARRQAIDLTIQEFSTKEAESRRGLLVLDSPPLWHLSVSDYGWDTLRLRAGQSWRDQREGLGTFVRLERGRMTLHALLFVLLCALLLVVGRSVHGEGEGEGVSPSTEAVFSRPLSASLLVALLLTEAVYPYVPLAVARLVLLVSIVPVLRLLPRLLRSQLKWVLLALAGLVALDLVVSFLPAGSALQRLWTLVVGLIGLVGCVYLMKFGTPSPWVRWSRWWQAARVGLGAAGTLLTIGIVANIQGWTVLADTLTYGTFLSVYLAVLLLAAVFVFSGLVRALPHTAFGRASLMVTNRTDLVVSTTLSLLRLTAVVVWVYLLVRIFEVGAPVRHWATRTIEASLTLGSLDVSVGDVLGFGVVIWLAALLSRLVRFVLQEEVLPRLQLQRGAAEAGATLAHWTILAVGIVAASAAAGITGAHLVVIAGTLGIGIGFGLQSAMNNFISGLILIAERPIKVGDTIEVGTLLGEVTRIGFRASTVRTRDGAEIVVPNGSLTSERLVNWTLSDHTRRIEVPLGVEYGTEPERVIDLLLAVAASHDEVLDAPPAAALFLGFGESSMDFALRCWISRFDDWHRVRSEMAVAVNRSLKEEGIGIAFPRRNVQLQAADSEADSGPETPPSAERDGDNHDAGSV